MDATITRTEDLAIRLLGHEYILDKGGAIAAREVMEAGEVSYAHLLDNGEVRRFGTIIARDVDIEVLGPVDVNFGFGMLMGLLGPTWREDKAEFLDAQNAALDGTPRKKLEAGNGR